jgi:DNA-binding MltR family transcriptional regulator
MWISQSEHGPNMGDLLKEVEGISDRAGAIVLSALVEDHLITLLKASLHQEEVIIKEMFNGTGPLAAFSTKIKLAFLIGLISEKALKNLDYIRKIRNAFAHNYSVSSFDSSPVRELYQPAVIKTHGPNRAVRWT